MNATDIAAALSYRAEELCRRYLPDGRRQGNYWTIGNLDVQPYLAGLDQLLRSVLPFGLTRRVPLSRSSSCTVGAQQKYKRLRRHQRRAALWLQRIMKERRNLFAHWNLSRSAVGR